MFIDVLRLRICWFTLAMWYHADILIIWECNGQRGLKIRLCFLANFSVSAKNFGSRLNFRKFGDQSSMVAIRNSSPICGPEVFVMIFAIIASPKKAHWGRGFFVR